MISVQISILIYKEDIVDNLTEQPQVRELAKTSIIIVVVGFAPDCM